jgi:hypothetical protein
MGARLEEGLVGNGQRRGRRQDTGMVRLRATTILCYNRQGSDEVETCCTTRIPTRSRRR